MIAVLTAERLRELLTYDPETGEFKRRVSRAGNAPAGAVAGYDDGRGYLRFMVDGRRYRAHRLAWLYVHGEWPKDQLDHRNGIRRDTRVSELREASNAENSQNLTLSPRNTSGENGVNWNKGKWQATITINKKKIYLGRFLDIKDAATAYADAKAKIHAFQPTLRETTP